MITIYIMSGILLLSVIGIIILSWKAFKQLESINNNNNRSDNIDCLTTIVEMMKEDKRNRDQEKSDKELMEYALKNKKRLPAGEVHISGKSEETPVNIKSHDLVPYGLSTQDRAILEEFYRH